MANYTDEQRNKIMQMPAAVLLDTMVADVGSAVVGMREFMAGEKFISEAGNMYPKNPLIQYMTKNVNLPKMEESVKHIFSIGEETAMRQECQRKIDEGVAVLGRDQEADEFKSFLVALAEKVANAAGEGFFGNKGTRVSANETAQINQLKQKLHIS